MSKYENLWNYIEENGTQSFCLTFDEIAQITGVPLDHSFLTYKKELEEFGWKASKISMKNKSILFEKIAN
ncbi:hypothetical protein [uncultured Treponema sp.]|uniref:hypothetical protein n=1 Tax=uncultured Treponema sp. TaxID=162155 RepID=UPI0025FC4FA9|nr:hypothetical protein [uncultured Treponema sp.]